MADLPDLFKEAWSHAVAGYSAAEQEAERVLSKLADAAGLSPDDVKRHARELGERLALQRWELERAIDDAARRAANRFRIPTKEDIDLLEKRLDAISRRIDSLAKERTS